MVICDEGDFGVGVFDDEDRRRLVAMAAEHPPHRAFKSSERSLGDQVPQQELECLKQLISTSLMGSSLSMLPFYSSPSERGDSGSIGTCSKECRTEGSGSSYLSDENFEPPTSAYCSSSEFNGNGFLCFF